LNQTEQLLSGLRDIHEPPVPEGLSLWLLAANLLSLLLVVLAVLVRRQRQRGLWRRQALHQIASARSLAPGPGLLLLAGTLRQIMIARTGQARLDDEPDWLESLNQAFNTRWFTDAGGRVFGPALYTRAAQNAQVDELCDTLSILVNRLPAQPLSVRPTSPGNTTPIDPVNAA
jgi:hypothetical protein